jgi:proline iminopeptidase
VKAAVRGTSLYFDVDGSALSPEGGRLLQRPTAILVHGGPGGDHSAYKPVLGPLTEAMQLIYYDQRGQGRSERGDPARYTLDENVEDMEALREYLGLDRVVSIGASYGGMVAMAHAARYPDSVSHLILIATAAHAAHLERAGVLVRERGSPEQVAQFDKLLAGQIATVKDMKNYFGIMAPLYARRHDATRSATSTDKPIYEPVALQRSHGPGGFLRTYDLRPELREIRATTLVVAGRHDWICAPEFSIEIHKHIAGSDLRIFEASGHSILSDEPSALLDLIKGFVVYNNGQPT